MVLEFGWKKKWSDVQLFTDSWAVTSGWSGTWKDHVEKVVKKTNLGKMYVIGLSKWAKDVKIFVSHVNAHQNATSAKKEK